MVKVSSITTTTTTANSTGTTTSTSTVPSKFCYFSGNTSIGLGDQYDKQEHVVRKNLVVTKTFLGRGSRTGSSPDVYFSNASSLYVGDGFFDGWKRARRFLRSGSSDGRPQPFRLGSRTVPPNPFPEYVSDGVIKGGERQRTKILEKRLFLPSGRNARNCHLFSQPCTEMESEEPSEVHGRVASSTIKSAVFRLGGSARETFAPFPIYMSPTPDITDKKSIRAKSLHAVFRPPGAGDVLNNPFPEYMSDNTAAVKGPITGKVEPGPAWKGSGSIALLTSPTPSIVMNLCNCVRDMT